MVDNIETNYYEIYFINEEEPSKLEIVIKISDGKMERLYISDLIKLVNEEAKKLGIKEIYNLRDVYNHRYDDPTNEFYKQNCEQNLIYFVDMFPLTYTYDKEISIYNSKNKFEALIKLKQTKNLTIKQFKKDYLFKQKIELSFNNKMLKDEELINNYVEAFTADTIIKIETPDIIISEPINIQIEITELQIFKNLNVSTLDTISSLKYELKREVEFDLKNRLKFKNKILEDDKQLCYYDIINNSILILSGNKETAPVFVDVTKNNVIDLEFNKGAPEWRICGIGLNVEGNCENKDCKAYNKQVICRFPKKELFDLINDSDLLKCPICENNFEPITCGFSNCLYSFTGMKIVTKGRKEKIAKSEMTKVGNCYRYFNPIDCKTQYQSLKIIVDFDLDKIPNEKKSKITCDLCKKEGTDEDKLDRLKNCSHVYHDSCIKNINNDCKVCKGLPGRKK